MASTLAVAKDSISLLLQACAFKKRALATTQSDARESTEPRASLPQPCEAVGLCRVHRRHSKKAAAFLLALQAPPSMGPGNGRSRVSVLSRAPSSQLPQRKPSLAFKGLRRP